MDTRKKNPVPQVVHIGGANSAPRWDLWLVAAILAIGKLMAPGRS